jgi:A/G-specific adenine glycosylase
MLQQTRVDTVTPYYLRFIDQFPTVDILARSPLGDILKVWENLGYYARVRNLHKAAGEIAARFGGRIPERLEEILRLPGIGRYTAGAILSIAFGQAVPAVDGNVRRVISRLYAIEESVDDDEVRERIEELVKTLVPTRDPGRFNQALMELGAVCCTPKSPVCPSCPLQDDCRARLQGVVHRLPVRGKKKSVPHREVVAAVIRDGEGRLLLVQRPSNGLLGSLWKGSSGTSSASRSASARRSPRSITPTPISESPSPPIPARCRRGTPMVRHGSGPMRMRSKGCPFPKRTAGLRVS